jgi:SAM-dependent methyltransferase
MAKKRAHGKRKEEIAAERANKVDLGVEWGEYSKPYQSSRIHWILYFVKPLSGRVLDVACFDGYIAEKIKGTGNKKVFGVDLSQKAVQVAQARGIWAQVMDLDTEPLPYNDSFFDCVVAGEIIEHVYDPDALVAEMRRVLRPGGVLILTTPNLANLVNRVHLLFGGYPDCMEPRAKGSGHIRLFTFPVLKRLLEDHAFQVDTMLGTLVRLPLVTYFSGFQSKRLARLFPRLAQGIVVKATKTEDK